MSLPQDSSALVIIALALHLNSEGDEAEEELELQRQLRRLDNAVVVSNASSTPR
jgi:hypothetical protein